MAISNADFDARRAELQRGIALAQDEYASASLKELTGAGTDADVEAAKAHLDALRDKLAALEAAHIAAQAQFAADVADDRQKRFDDVVAVVDAALSARRQAVQAIEDAATALGEALNSYDQAGKRLRTAANSVCSGTVDAVRNAMAPIDMALSRETNTAFKLAAVVLGELNVQIAPGGRRADAFPRGDVLAFEDRQASQVRAGVQRLAPTVEA
jgi:hypothetical protein